MKNDSHTLKNTTTITHKDGKDTAFKFEKTPKDMSIAVDHTPEALNSKDMSFSVHADAKVEFGSKNWEGEVSAQISTPELTPVKAFVDVSTQTAF